MKLNFSNLRSQSSEAAAKLGQQGIALVITLVMLSVTLVMALAFLALAHRERSSVSTATDTTNAKLAADSGLAAAQAQIIANVLAADNEAFNYGLLISTNYSNPFGFDPKSSNPTNVNYNYYITTGLGPLSQADFEKNVANLEYFPRVPVFVQTNPGSPLDFRFYLDLNRNGQFDDSGDNLPNIVSDGTTNGFGIHQLGDPQWIGILARPDTTHSANNQFLARFAFIALPVGNGLDLNAIHSQPYTQNEPVDSSYLNYANSAYIRNEGVGSWEINLAAFLADLNTNQWDVPGGGNEYQYNEPGFANKGAAFDDALSILSYRYNHTLNSLYPFTSLFGYGGNLLQGQPFDLNPTGPLLAGPLTAYYANLPGNLWAGSDNTNRFNDLPSELFNPLDSSPNFTNRLIKAGTQNTAANPSTYDRYTFYRMLAQLSTDSDPDDGKMNLNFRNITNGVVVPNLETNCFVWSPIEFFTNAADRMLRLYTTNWFESSPSNYLVSYYNIATNYYHLNANGDTVTNDPIGFGLRNASFSPYLGWTNIVPGFGITNIPVFVNGRFVYSPAVNRVLQLAANLYDASTTNFYPSVFRPLFEHDNLGNVFVVGFTNLSNGNNTVSGLFDGQLSTPFDPLAITNYGAAGQILITNTSSGTVPINVYGVPWIIGAKKGFPAFNKFGMQTIVQATRKMQIQRSSIPTDIHSTTFRTNQLIAFSIHNFLNADCWNSYSNAYSHPVNIIANDTISMVVTNNVGALPNYFYNYLITSNTYINPWPGYSNNPSFTALSFTNPLSAVVTLLSNSDFYFGSSPPGITGFYPDSLRYGWESNNFNFTFPQFGLLVTNRLQLYMLDSSGGAGEIHVIDYVQLGGLDNSINLSAAIETNNPTQYGYGSNMWSQAVNSYGVPYGIASQVLVSEQNIAAYGGNNYWLGGANLNNQAMIDGFCTFMGLSSPYPGVPQNNPTLQYYATNYVAQVPFTPTVTLSYYNAWQVNDPLVHYLASDLTFVGVEKPSGVQTGLQVQYGATGNVLEYPSFNVVNDRYQPWSLQYTNNLPVIGPNAIVQSAFGLAVKDPLVWSSDDWNFPTNLYPTVGWIGRVHRGTPWQTVYLKAHDVLHVLDPYGDIASGTNTWTAWTGDYNQFDAANSVPVQDRLLFDLFTSRPNDNAALGTLSVNQTNLAAWSAVLSGMVVLRNTTTLPTVLNPKYASIYRSIPVQYNSLTIQPAAFDVALQNILTNINFARFGTNLAYGFTNVDHVAGAFEHVGDILAAPALSEYSPFLNVSAAQQQYGINDAEYEWVPQQMMGLVRASSTPRYVVYAYGQSLRPAPNGLDTSSTYFGLVTNYQVVAESAVRAVISVQSKVDMSGAYPVTNYTTHVESYNVLPAD